MVSSAIHRVVERQAASRGDTFACVDGRRALTYRELNCRANAFARALIAAGFRRGATAAIRMARSTDAVVALLGTLKAGGAYLWSERGDAPWPAGVSIVQGDGGQRQYVAVDVARVFEDDCAPTPNLPILTRGSDIACLVAGKPGAADVFVPHATILALRQQQPGPVMWGRDSGMFDVWLALMAGATVTVTTAPEAVAA